jgi:hypothetical protein
MHSVGADCAKATQQVLDELDEIDLTPDLLHQLQAAGDHLATVTTATAAAAAAAAAAIPRSQPSRTSKGSKRRKTQTATSSTAKPQQQAADEEPVKASKRRHRESSRAAFDILTGGNPSKKSKYKKKKAESKAQRRLADLLRESQAKEQQLLNWFQNIQRRLDFERKQVGNDAPVGARLQRLDQLEFAALRKVCEAQAQKEQAAKLAVRT